MLNPKKNMPLEKLFERFTNNEITKEEFKVFLTGKLFRNRREAYRYKPNREVLRNIGEVNGNIEEVLKDIDYFEYLRVNGIEVKCIGTTTYFLFKDNGGR